MDEVSTGDSSYFFKKIDSDGDTNADSGAKESISTDAEDRAGGEGALKALKSSKTFKSLQKTMAKTANSFSEKVSPALPLKSRLQIWSNNEKPLDFVKKKLGLDQVLAAAFTGAKNYKLYDDYVTSQLPIWAKKELTPDEVMEKLGIEKLSGEALTSNPNFKYFDEFVSAQTLVWGKKDLSTEDVLVRLGLNTLSGTARTDAVNHKYYDEFVINQMRSWLKTDVSLGDAMVKLKLDKLSGDALLSHPNYGYYKSFVTNKLKSWATDESTFDDILASLGLTNLKGTALESHPNYTFLAKFMKNMSEYRQEAWLKQKLSTFDIWQKLEVHRVRPTIRRSSSVYGIYKKYVNMMDDYIIDQMTSGFTVPKLISKDATLVELQAKTLIWVEAKRPEWYVKYSLGLDDLEGEALKEAANFRFLERYLEGIKHMK
ncbi:hypothetical protein PRNP1_012446 [Phytophthora ramorum]